MKKILVSAVMFAVCSTLVLAGGVAGTWNASLETEDGTWEFTVVYEVDGDKITGEFITEMGDLKFGPGTIKRKEFEYTFEIDYVTYTHKGKLVKKDEILIKSTNESGDETDIVLKRDKGAE